MAANEHAAVIPRELRKKVSPGLTMFVDEWRAVKGLGILLSAFPLYGPVTRHPDHNGFSYLVLPWICPSIVAFFWSSLHHRPYRGQVYSGMSDVDANDASVRRLVELYDSDEARHHLWIQSLQFSATLFAILGIAALMLRNSLNWVLPSPRNGFLLNDRGQPGHFFWGGVVGCFVGSFLVLGGGYARWCLITWAKREQAHQGGQY
jgi:hypothetical protein